MPEHSLVLSTNPSATLGPEQLNEPFACYTDGAFGLTNIGTQVVAMPSVNALSCDEWNFSGPDVDHLVPTAPMNGLTYNTHQDRSRVYDTLGWWPYNIWVDNSTSPATWYSYMHTEDGSNCDNGSSSPDGTDLRTIGVWTSTDQGANWSYQGVAVDLDSSVAFNPPSNNCHSESLSNPPPNWIGGPGDHKFIVGQDGYLYLLYGQFTYDATTPTTTHGNLAIARSSASDKGAPGKWYKYYNGSFSQAGQGGHETYIMSAYNSGQISNNQRTVAWNTYLSKYVMVFDSAGTGLYITYSSDLVTWSTPELIYKQSGQFLAYANLVGIGTGANGTDSTIGRSAWLYYLKAGGGPGTGDYEWYRRLISWDSQANLAGNATVTVSTNFNGGSNLTDTNLSTCFCPTPTSTSYAGISGWAYIDMGSQKSFNEVKLYPENGDGLGFPQDFSFLGSNDALSWTSIATYSAYPQPDGATQVFSLGSQSYRYVKLNVTGVSNATSTSFALKLQEMQVYNDTQGIPPQPNTQVGAARSYQASTGFASTQGQDQWFYMFEAPNETGTGDHLSPMTYDSPNSRWLKSGSFSIVTSNTQSPDAGKDSSRVWRSPAAGAVHITGQVKKADTTSGDGVKVRIKRNFSTIWPLSGGWQSIAYNDGVGYSVDIYAKVNAGDRIFFTVNENSTPSYDTTSWDPKIDFSPLTGSWTASAGFSSTNMANQWAYQYFDGTNYTNMTWDSPSSCWVRSGTFTKICKNWQHPDVSSDSVREWIAPYAGIASVTGWAKKGDTTGGDGTLVQIRKNPATLEWGINSVAYNNASGLSSEVSMPVIAGDILLFIVDYSASNSYDTTVWDPTVWLSSWQPINNSPFKVGEFVQPPVKPTDYNTAANWQNIAASNADVSLNVADASLNYNHSDNATGIANSKTFNVCLQALDNNTTPQLGINGYQTYTAAEKSSLDALVANYKNDGNACGLFLKDEPFGYNLEGFANTYKEASSYAPALSYYVNLLPSSVEVSGSNWLHEARGLLVLDNSASGGSTSTLSTTNVLGQTFTVPTGITYVDGIDVNLDGSTWASNETLTLTLWNSPSKTTQLATAALTGDALACPDYLCYPYFKLGATVTSGTSYYYELVVSGGNGAISGVSRSSSSVYSGGQAYVNGVSQTNDFWFRLYSTRPNTPEINVNSSGGGDYVNSSTTLGQTFTTPSALNRRVHYIQPYIDYTTWTSGQPLTITIWDSPLKSHQIGVSQTLTATNNGYYPFFYLFTKLQSSTSYYWELTSTSSTNVGWVVESTSDVYSGGVAYKNGAALSSDFYFNMHFGSEYENYLDDWVTLSGAPFLQYDDYPFLTSSDEASWFAGMEMVRDRALGNSVTYGDFIQSFGDGSHRVPTVDQERYDLYLYLTYGFKYMYWFEYWQCCGFTGDAAVDATGHIQSNYYNQQELSSEMRMLGMTIKNLTSQGAYNLGAYNTSTGLTAMCPWSGTGPSLCLPAGTNAIPSGFFVRPMDVTQPITEGYFTDGSGRKFIMLTNRDYNNARTVAFQFRSNPFQVTEISKTTGLEMPVPGYSPNTGVMTIDLKKGEGRLFALPTGYSPTSNWAWGAFGSSTSSAEGGGWGIGMANDAQRNSVANSMGWTSNSNLTTNHTESITLDMQATNTISRVDLYPRNDSGNVGQGFPINFTIQVATSPGGPWTTVVTQTNYAMPGNSVQSFTFTSTSARFIRVQGTSLRQITTEPNTPYRMQFAEIESYT